VTPSRRSFLASALGGVGALACGNAMGGGAKAPGGSELIGAKAPDFSLAPAGGGAPLSPSAFEGKVLVVDFWATWCKPCRESFPAYQRMIDKYAGRVAVIGVSVDEDASGIERFRSETGVKFPLVWDEGQVAASVYKPGTMPTCYIVDRSGFVQFIHEGFRAGDEATFEENVKGLL
jgi:cytochrome c biogenesis protein CcmG/thiol:disulfide interchange protein DsbE